MRKSFGQKYNFIFKLMLATLLISETANILLTLFVMRTYDENYSGLKTLHDVYRQVEYIKEDVDYYYTFSDEEYHKRYQDDRKELQDRQGRLKAVIDRQYCRTTTDFYYTTISYAEASEDFFEWMAIAGNPRSSGEAARQLEEKADHFQSKYQNLTEVYSEACGEQMLFIEESRKNVRRIWGITILFQILVLLAGVGESFRYHNKVKKELSYSLEALTNFAETITITGKFPEQPLHLDTGDEISVLAEAFNAMLDSNSAQLKQIQENARIREQLQKAEMENMKINNDLKTSKYKLLESRINPHFLFNTLNMILQAAYIEEARDTSKLIAATADFLRYNLRHLSRIGTILEEIQNVKNYTYIQECRYGDRIRFCYELDETLYYHYMPCMILQPLVENAVTHGVKSMTKEAVVRIRLFREDGRICLEVEDNGAGIAEAQMEHLKEQMNVEEMSNEHIGLQNVNMRLKLYFGSNVDFGINSRPGRTICSIRMTPEEK